MSRHNALNHYFCALMRSIALITALSILLAATASCSYTNNNNTRQITIDTTIQIPAGIIVDSASIPVTTGDGLNHFNFTLAVATTDQAKYGIYDVRAAWGPHNAASQFTMPHGGEQLKPVIRKNEKESVFTIGFFFGNDTTFHDYYEVSSIKGGNIEMKYLKAYSFK